MEGVLLCLLIHVLRIKRIERQVQRINTSISLHLMNLRASANIFCAAIVCCEQLYIGRFHPPKRGAALTYHADREKPTKNDERLWKRALWVVSWGVWDGWEHAGDVARGRESHLSAFLRRHCAPVYIDYEIERGSDREGGRKGAGGRRRKRARFIAVLAYCRGSADVLFFGLFFIFAARHARTRGTTPRVLGVYRLLSARREFRPFPRDGQSRHCRRKFPTDGR